MLLEVTAPMIQKWVEDTPAEVQEDFVFYLMVGPANQNSRSMVMDGEVALLVASWASVTGLMDFVSLASQSTWVEDLEDLERLIPEYSGLRRLLAGWIRLAL